MGKGAALAIEIRPQGREPVFLALARAIIQEIERGRLKPGDPLPGTRALSRSLGLNRNTVDAAYHELSMQGWLAAEPARGTFVAGDLPAFSGKDRATAVVGNPGKSVSEQTIISLADGTPDVRLAPTLALARAFRRAVTAPAFLGHAGYDDPRGSFMLREALAVHLREERGLAVAEGDMLITRGSQMALFLAAQAVAESGAAIAVETPGYPLAWAAFRAAGARIVGVPVDASGIDIAALEALAEREPRLRAVYVTPHHHYPTTVTLGAARRLRLIDLARRRGLTIIEDDYDHEYRFDGRPVLPLAARAEADVPIIYLGSLSKLLAPGIRAGFAVAAPALSRRMAERREAIDRQGDLPLEHALASLIADGAIKRHARKARRIYHRRRDHLASLLNEHLADVADFTLPAGGLAIWLRLKPGLIAADWAMNAAARGLAVLSGDRFALEVTQAPEAFRLGFAHLDEKELQRAIELFVKARKL
jgi:GntR family transcriptional regulator/MocR family aminotransferase